MPAPTAPFVYDALPGRVRFGEGALDGLTDEIAHLGLARVLVLSTAGKAALAKRVASLIGDSCVGTFSGAVMHTPVEVTETAVAEAERLRVDGLVAVGGGSTIGLGKAIALRTDLPQIAIPTTYAGSEMTPVIGQTRDGAKATETTMKVLPEVVIYDARLTLDLPVGISGTSGINAIAHAVEALYARNRNPLIDLIAVEGTRSLAEALPLIAADPGNLEARTEAQYGAWLCGICLANAGMALHHKLCHTLGGSYGLPHAETHTVILPHALAYNAPAAEGAVEALRGALNTVDPALALQELARKMGAPLSLRELGFAKSDIDGASDRVLAKPYWNPRPVEREPLRRTLLRAWEGHAPASD